MSYSATVSTGPQLHDDMVRSDPYTPVERVYECIDCGHRTTGSGGRCPDCGTDMKNIAVPRE